MRTFLILIPLLWSLSLQADFQVQVLVSNLVDPMKLSISPEGDVYFAERLGSIKKWKKTDGQVQSLGQIPNLTIQNEDGVLSLALDPGFATNHFLYAFHSRTGVASNFISRFTVANDQLDLNSQKIIYAIPRDLKHPNHAGGGLEIDSHGDLWISIGDNSFITETDGFSPLDQRPGRELWDAQRTAANTADCRGKILRIHPEPDGHYSIPKGNLFPPGTPNTLPEIYVMGTRNPFRFSFDDQTGWLTWGDVGPDALQADPQRGPAGFDEFNLAKTPGFFGWPLFLGDNRPYHAFDFENKTGGEAFDPQHPKNSSRNNTGLKNLPAAQPALIWYPPGPSARFPTFGSGARSAMSGPIYHHPGKAGPGSFPKSLEGHWFIYEWERSWIHEVELTAEGQVKKVTPFLPGQKWRRPIDLKFARDGSLYLVEYGTAWGSNKDGRISRIYFE